MMYRTMRVILDFIHRLVYMTKNHSVSETGSVSVLRWMGQGRPTQLGPLERASLNHWKMDKVQNKPHSSVYLSVPNYFCRPEVYILLYVTNVWDVFLP
jgi:hypothetical protein